MREAQPDFLRVDENARKGAIDAGGHENSRTREREEALAALDAAGKPLNLGKRMAGLAAFAMSLFTLATTIFGAVTNVSKMGETLESVSSIEKIQIVLAEHWLGALVAAFVIGWHVYKTSTAASGKRVIRWSRVRLF